MGIRNTHYSLNVCFSILHMVKENYVVSSEMKKKSWSDISNFNTKPHAVTGISIYLKMKSTKFQTLKFMLSLQIKCKCTLRYDFRCVACFESDTQIMFSAQKNSTNQENPYAMHYRS